MRGINVQWKPLILQLERQPASVEIKLEIVAEQLSRAERQCSNTPTHSLYNKVQPYPTLFRVRYVLSYPIIRENRQLVINELVEFEK